ncbi:nonribosomal peptide synthase [Aspergillus alliaceus]|uniref:nonribosomal peptide synthase n=1 Tax=Petromyces alliaceus TaxID=209559 RepID=UPI0012A6A2C1|nr:nonribosomal peptide synthase [Aspergillus alliaceus]KAB8233936.1 nonribosomal peptide synthase [Aspergillus alliaceus]
MSNMQVPGDLAYELPGRFPKLNETGGHSRQTALVTLQANQCNALARIPKDGATSIYQQLMSAWPVLLAEYLDSYSVCFGTLESETGYNTIEQWSAVVHPGQPISQSVTLEKAGVLSLTQDAQDAPFNTYLARKGSTARSSFPTSSHTCVPMAGDITLIADDSLATPGIDCYYTVSFMSRKQAENVITALGAVLDHLTSSSLLPLRELTLPHHDHYRQIASWNNRAPKRQNDHCIHYLFQLQCTQTPGAQAVCAWDGCFTYHEVDILSTKLAARLRTHGISEECIVPILVEKSRWAVVGILGVLKAGAAFVLLDISYPVARLQTLCQDFAPRVLIRSTGAPAADLTETVIVVGDSMLDWAICEPPQTSVTPQNAAYISYTSGSTGRPKGVIIEHGSFCTNAIAISGPQNMRRSSRVLQYASFAFDVSIQECLSPLLLGGCTCIPSESQRVNDLESACAELQVNWAELTPSVARILQPNKVPLINTLVIGGETTSWANIAKWDRLHLISAYGPAECTIVSTVQPLLKFPGNIGRSFGGTTWIVDKENYHRLLPIGAVGELIIGGAIVGRGYLNRPAQTEAAFIKNADWKRSFGLEDSYRLYRTGDLAKYDGYGNIIYVGRKDTQIKINGQRVELGEIEHHAQICLRDFAVSCELIASHTQRHLLALFVAPTWKFAKCVSISSLLIEPDHEFRQRISPVKTRLQSTLPRHMVPTAYIPMTEIPLTRTGKVDRKLLQSAIAQLSDAQMRKYRSLHTDLSITLPRKPLEERVRELFATVLELRPNDIGTDQSFFELGGDSMASISLVKEARKKGLDITVAEVFQSQTISDLAAKVQDMQGQKDRSTPQPFSLLSDDNLHLITGAAEQCKLDPSDIDDLYPCTPVQEAMIGNTAVDPSAFQARFLFRLSPTIDISRLRHAWDVVIAAHPILRTRIVQIDTPRALQVVVSHKKDMPWCSVEQVQEYRQPLMSHGTPLIHLGIAREQGKESPPTLILSMHHAIFDGWSYAILLEEVDSAYRGLKVSPQSFSPFIRYILAQDMDTAERFWKSEFQNLNSAEFPVPAPTRNYKASRSVARVRSTIQIPTWPRGSYTPSTIIRLAYAMLIASYTHSNDVVFGITVNGRNAPVPQIHDLDAPTIATLPLRTMLDSHRSVEDTLIEMQEHATRLIPYEQTGLRWIKSFGPEAVRACAFQSLLIIQPPTSRSMPELFRQLPVTDAEQSKFSTHPLTLICELSEHPTLNVTAMIDPAVISPQRTKGMLQHFEDVIQQLSHNRERPVNGISFCQPITSSPLSQPSVTCHLEVIEKRAQEIFSGGSVAVAGMVVAKDSSSAILAVFVCDSRIGFDALNEPKPFRTATTTYQQIMSRLGQHLRHIIPSTLSPYLCLPVSNMPRCPTGQPDRQALCNAASKLCWDHLRDFAYPDKKKASRPNPIRLAKICSMVALALGLDQGDIGHEDDFFDLGGDSASAMQVVISCKREGLSLTAHDIFQERKVGLIACKLQPLAAAEPLRKGTISLPLSNFFSQQHLTQYTDIATLEADVKSKLRIPSMDAIEDAYPCTRVHGGLLRTQSLSAFSYVSQTIWEVVTDRLDKPICPFRLRDAWLAVARRHPGLRTVLVNNSGREQTCEKIHVVLRGMPSHVPVLSSVSETLVYESDSQIGISGPLPYSFTIYQTKPGRVFCKLQGHQAFLDATSVSVILEELANAYGGILPSTVGPSYRSAVEYLSETPSIRSLESYWEKKMAAALPCIFPKLHSEKARPEALRITSGQIGDSTPLRQYCSRNGFTLSNMFQVAWGLTLQLYTGQDDVCFGTLVTGRDLPLPDVHNTVGSFFNVLPCQLQLSAPTYILETLQQNQMEIANRLTHQSCSLQDLLRLSNHFGQVLFNTCFSLEKPLSNTPSDNGIRFQEISTLEPTEYGLFLVVIDKGAEFEARLTYWSSLMTEEQAAEVLGRFVDSACAIAAK